MEFHRILNTIYKKSGELQRVEMMLEPLDDEARSVVEAASRLVDLTDRMTELRRQVDQLRKRVVGPLLEEVEKIEDEAARGATIWATLGDAVLTIASGVERRVAMKPEQVHDVVKRGVMYHVVKSGEFTEHLAALLEEFFDKLGEMIDELCYVTERVQRRVTVRGRAPEAEKKHAEEKKRTTRSTRRRRVEEARIDERPVFVAMERFLDRLEREARRALDMARDVVENLEEV